jgi:phenylalanine-4-hydroxylase
VKRDELLTEKVIKWCQSAFLEKIKPLIISKERVVTFEEVENFFQRYMTEKE